MWVEPSVVGMAKRIAGIRPELHFNEFSAFGVLLGQIGRRTWIRNPALAGRGAVRALQRRAIGRFDAVTFTNDHHRSLWPVAPERLEELPYPIDIAFWRDVPARTTAAWADVGLPPPAGPVLMYVANLAVGKRHPALVAGLAPLLRDRPEVRLTLVGGEVDAGLEAEVDAIAAREGVGAEVVRTGFLDRGRIRALLAWADVSVVNTAHETQCMVLYESLAAGVPVVMSDIPELRSQLPFVPAHADAEQLCDNVGRLLDERDARAQQLVDAAPHLERVDVGRHDELCMEISQRLLDRALV